MDKSKMGTFAYACECSARRCRRRVTLTHPEYLRASRRGQVLAADCPERLAVARSNAAALRAAA